MSGEKEQWIKHHGTLQLACWLESQSGQALFRILAGWPSAGGKPCVSTNPEQKIFMGT